MNTGNWTIKVTKNLPQKIASAFAEPFVIGVRYDPIAYLGQQLVNGLNHAVLATQTSVPEYDWVNLVIMIFNERPGKMDVSLVGVNPIIETDGLLGHVEINPTCKIAEKEKKIWDEAFEEFVGSIIEPFAFIGKQETESTNYVFAATVRSFEGKNEKAVLVTINPLLKKVSINDLLNNKPGFGYAFNW